MDVNQELLKKMRTDFASGVEPCEIIDLVYETLGVEKKSCMTGVLYFIWAFHLPIRKASLLDPWEGFKNDYERGTYSSERINGEMRPLIQAKEEIWREFT